MNELNDTDCDNFAAALLYLNKLGTKDKAHSGATLYQHLCGVYNILRDEGESFDVCLSGLYHSIYGTQYFKNQTTTDRFMVREIIGERAEFLVWLFSIIDRDKWYESYGDLYKIRYDGGYVIVSPEDERALTAVIEANTSEQRKRRT